MPILVPVAKCNTADATPIRPTKNEWHYVGTSLGKTKRSRKRTESSVLVPAS